MPTKGAWIVEVGVRRYVCCEKGARTTKAGAAEMDVVAVRKRRVLVN